MNHRERAKRDLAEWGRSVFEEEVRLLCSDVGLSEQEARLVVEAVWDALARAAFEKSRAGIRT